VAGHVLADIHQIVDLERLTLQVGEFVAKQHMFHWVNPPSTGSVRPCRAATQELLLLLQLQLQPQQLLVLVLLVAQVLVLEQLQPQLVQLVEPAMFSVSSATSSISNVSVSRASSSSRSIIPLMRSLLPGHRWLTAHPPSGATATAGARTAATRAARAGAAAAGATATAAAGG
jgi:hypothetical protein